MPNRTVLPPLLGLLERSGVAGRRRHTALRHGDPSPGDPGRDAGAGGPRDRGPLHHRRPRLRRWRPRRGGTGRRHAHPVAARVRRGRRPHHHRVRRAALLRRLQRWAQGGVPGTRRHRDHPGGPPPPPHRRCRVDVRHPAGEPGARFRPCRGGAGSPRTSRSTWRSTGTVRSPPSSPAPSRRRTTPPARSSGRPRCSSVAAPFDVVVSTNGGHPLDRNLYQAVKGMAAAERIVRPGGIIVMAAACGDGIPGRRRLCRRSLAGPVRPGTSSTRPEGRSSTAGRPRCWDGCCSGPRCGSTARA